LTFDVVLRSEERFSAEPQHQGQVTQLAVGWGALLVGRARKKSRQAKIPRKVQVSLYHMYGMREGFANKIDVPTH